MQRLQAAVPEAEREALISAVAGRELDPYTAVEQLFVHLDV
jgi:hypothetical protein